MTARQTDAITDPQSIIAALQQRLDAALAREAALAEELAAPTVELAERKSEFGERIAQQAATIDVLKVMSASPGDPQPVFDLIVRRATELCNGLGTVLFEFDGGLVHFRVSYFTEARDTAAYYAAAFPSAPTRGSISCRAILDREIVHIRDTDADLELSQVARELLKPMSRSQISIPLMRDGQAIGVISLALRDPGGFSDSQIEMLKTFAEQAVIAISSAEMYRALQTRTNDLQESLKYQTATSDVLKVISRSTFDLQPVLETVAATAARLCDAEQALIGQREGGDLIRLVANFGFPPEAWAHWMAQGATPLESVKTGVGPRTLLEGRIVHIHDVAAESAYPIENITLARQRTTLGVPLQRDGETVGCIVLARRRVEPFTDRQIDLVSTFADQAVIAIENTRLITEQREALEQQTATAEVLQVINASPGNLTPVFEAMLEKAMRLCGAAIGGIYRYNGQGFDTVALLGVTPEFQEYDDKYPMVKIQPGSMPARMIEARGPVQNPDVPASEVYLAGMPYARALVALGGIRAVLDVPLLKEGALLGFIAIYRKEAGVFSDKQIALLEGFAAQAVIAMESARLLDELRQRQEELRITFENMGDGVAMFDQTQHLVAWNRKFQDILDVPDDIIARRQTFTEYVRYLADRGEYGAGPGVEEQVRHLTEHAGQYRVYERTRPDGRVIEIRHNPVPSGGFVLIFSDITERKRSEAEIHTARDAAEAAYRDLKAAQANLIQAEKMASLGQLTAGIAHEIKNPLNFVNNFSALSAELIDELRGVLAPQSLGDIVRAEVDDLTALLKGNLEKVVQHGQRADGIVKAMLEHSRGSSAERRMVDLNVLIDEALNLGYHGARAQDQSFNITLERDFGEGIALTEVNPQDMTRVFLNIFSNGFYAATRRARSSGDAGFVPMLKVTTRDTGEAVEIRVRDNGTGIPAEIRDQLFQPFFTTKPTGEGTGLGLSITYDIITKQHGGTITVDSEVDAFTEFVITLPRWVFAIEEGRA